MRSQQELGLENRGSVDARFATYGPRERERLVRARTLVLVRVYLWGKEKRACVLQPAWVEARLDSGESSRFVQPREERGGGESRRGERLDYTLSVCTGCDAVAGKEEAIQLDPGRIRDSNVYDEKPPRACVRARTSFSFTPSATFFFSSASCFFPHPRAPLSQAESFRPFDK